MQHPDATNRGRTISARPAVSKSLASVALGCVAAAAFLVPNTAHADPAPAPNPVPAPAPAPAPAPESAQPPGAPNPVPGVPVPADPAAGTDPSLPPAPAPEPGRVDNAAGGLSYVVPAGWRVADQTRLNYGQALLTKIPPPGIEQSPSDTSVLLGRLDLKLFAGAEPDNAKAATRLASDMGEFFMPFAGTRINQEAGPLNAAGAAGAFSSYTVKFTDATKPDGQIWAGVVGEPPAPGTPRTQRPQRWFVVWLGSANQPVDKGAATALAQSIRPFTPPPPPEAPPPDPNAPPPGPNAPGGRNRVGVPVPVTDVPPGMTPGG